MKLKVNTKCAARDPTSVDAKNDRLRAKEKQKSILLCGIISLFEEDLTALFEETVTSECPDNMTCACAVHVHVLLLLLFFSSSLSACACACACA